MNYIPKPLDTSDIELSPEIANVIEKISANIHDVWAAGRMSEGWQYGSSHDAEKKTNPSLVSYAQLPESEKDYDRNTVTQTIKCLLKMGYTDQK